MPHTASVTAAATSTMPRRSRLRSAPFDSPSTRRVRGTATAATGRLIQKIHCQASPSVTAPPTNGPSATPSPFTAPHNPIAALRRAAGTALTTSVSDNGWIAAAPTPCRTLAAISADPVVASAHATEPRLNNVMPTRNTRRLPYRSPSAAAVSSRPANARM